MTIWVSFRESRFRPGRPIGRPHRFRLAPIHSAGSPLCGGAQTAPLGRPDGDVDGDVENAGFVEDLWEIYGKSLEHVGNIWKICGKPMDIYWKTVGNPLSAIPTWATTLYGRHIYGKCWENGRSVGNRWEIDGKSMEHVGKMALQPSPPA